MTADIKNDAQFPPEIAKYSAILGKDPKSMVFAPLAEAYRKAGMLDEAIKTAQEGLKLHPNYLSGMVALGRACYEKGMLKEAGEALGQVVKIAPDNIIASKILEEIKKQWPVVSGQGPETKAQGSVASGQGSVGWAAPTGQKPETEVEEAELVELEEVPEAEEVETEAVFGEEITEELWIGESIPEKRAEPKRGITTETIADLYIKQGYLDKAIDIYQTIYDADPYNEEIKGKLEELKRQGAGVVVSGQGSGVSTDLKPETLKLETEDENVKRLEAWLKSIQNERRKG